MSVSSFYSTDRAEEQLRLLKAILKEMRVLTAALEKNYPPRGDEWKGTR